MKIGIIGILLIGGILVFSSEINGLFPNTSITIIESLQNDVNDFGDKATESVEQSLDSSIDMVTKASSKIDTIVDNTRNEIYSEINQVKESPKNNLTEEITKKSPLKTISDVFKGK